jgi:hypothetical protein
MKRLGYILTCDYRPTAVFVSLFTLMWVVWLIVHPHMFSQSNAYGALGDIANERVWCAWMAFLVLAKWAVLWRGFRPDVTLAITMLALMTWVLAAVAVFYSNAATFGGPIYSVIAGMQAWVFLRHALERK